MKRIAITGGIGSGKSTVSRFFEHLGVPLYYSDDRAKWLMSNSLDLRNELIEAFGGDVFLDCGQLNRDYLSKVVFSSKEQLLLLNSLVHPAILRDFDCWVSRQSSPYVIMESAIIFDIGWQSKFDSVIVVTAPLATRIKRVVSRDGVDIKSVEQRLSNQMDESTRVELADIVVVCDDSELMIPQILHINELLCSGSILERR